MNHFHVGREGIRVSRFGANWWAVALILLAVSLGWRGIIFIGGLMIIVQVVTRLMVRALDYAADRKRPLK